MIITIAGVPGAGKTTAAVMLAEKLGYKSYSGGDIRGMYAQELGITIDELNDRAKKETEFHTKLDKFQESLGRKQDNFVMESWMGWFFIPDSFKVFLKVDARAGAERIFRQMRRQREKRKDEKVYSSVDEAVSIMKNRVKVQRQTMLKLYGKKADFLDESNYDLVVDTTDKSPEGTLSIIVKALKDKT